MPSFDTPEPISIAVELGVGDIQIAASDRTTTVVEVRPTNAAKKGDLTAAEQTRVEYAGGRLLIKAPKGWPRYSFWGGSESIIVEVAVPAGSHVRAEAAVAALRCTGRLGDCRYHTGVGDIHLDQVGPVQIKTGAGDITVDRILDSADVTTSSGAVEIGRVDGTAVVKNSNGDTWIGEVTGDLQVKAANGKISIDRALGSVSARTANGDVQLGEVVHGSVGAQTAFGNVAIGVRAGVAAWLDLNTGFGSVLNNLADARPPEPGEDSVEIRARSSCGDITVRRCLTHDAAEEQA